MQLIDVYQNSAYIITVHQHDYIYNVRNNVHIFNVVWTAMFEK